MWAGQQQTLHGRTVKRLQHWEVTPVLVAVRNLCGVLTDELSEKSWAPPLPTVAQGTWEPCGVCPSKSAASGLAGRAVVA
tara:strand:+ start:307 stop:546 length:240 start_codon:yes stop_codon:yes gene_type:complete